jgi:hypothetical protein
VLGCRQGLDRELALFTFCLFQSRQNEVDDVVDAGAKRNAGRGGADRWPGGRERKEQKEEAAILEARLGGGKLCS